MTYLFRWMKWRWWDRVSLATAGRFGVPLEAWERHNALWAAREPKRT